MIDRDAAAAYAPVMSTSLLVRKASGAALIAAALVFVETARAAPLSGCTEETFGAACDSGDNNPCSGVCFPDFSAPNAPMSCLPADAALLSRLHLASLEGVACSTNGAPGQDCAHACQAGQCAAMNAASGAACRPAAVEAGLQTVCQGACDGAGSCAVLDQGCEKYGRGEACLYTACNARTNAPGCEQYPLPKGVACDDSNMCTSGDACIDNGICAGQPIAGCTLGSPDAGKDTQGATSGGGEESSGCSLADGGAALSAFSAGVIAAALLAAGRRRGRRR